jgi:hypothetical protein
VEMKRRRQEYNQGTSESSGFASAWIWDSRKNQRSENSAWWWCDQQWDTQVELNQRSWPQIRYVKILD